MEVIESNNQSSAVVTQGEDTLAKLVGILEDMIQDWGLDLDEPLGARTHLIADLGFESIDVVQFISAIEETFHSRTIPFEELVMVEGRYVDEIVIEDVVKFLARHLA